jgi:hypothetical protein
LVGGFAKKQVTLGRVVAGYTTATFTRIANSVGESSVSLSRRRRTMNDGYHCVVCGRFLLAVDGVIVHDDIPHPDMAFDDEENPQ